MMRYATCLLISIFSVIGQLKAQSDFYELTIYHAGNSGLPGNYVQAVCIDNSDNLWLGTFGDGLAMFDGDEWSVFTTSNSPLPANNIYAVTVDSLNNKWLGTDEGLVKFDDLTWSVWNTDNSGLPDNRVRAVTVENSNTIWLGSQVRLTKFDLSSFTVYDSTNSSLPQFPNYYSILFIVIDDSGRKWLGGDGGGLLSFDDVNWTRFDHSNSTVTDPYVTSGARSPDGSLWFATSKEIATFDGTSWMAFRTASGMPLDVPNVIAVDKKDAVWSGGLGGRSLIGGLARFVNNNWTHITPFNSNLPDNRIIALAVDGANNKWIGTTKGLARFEGSQVINLESPMAGKAFEAGSIIYLSWTARIPTLFNLAYSTDDGRSWISIVENWTQFDAMPYEWTIPEIIPFSETCRVRVQDANDTTSFALSEQFAMYVRVEKPALNPPPGMYALPQHVEMTSATELAKLHYTTDGTVPDETSPQYSVPVLVDSDAEIHVIALKDGYFPSDTTTGVYRILDQEIELDIQYDRVLLDSDFDGLESGRADASNSSISYGEIDSYIWTVRKDTISTSANASFILPSGTNRIFVEAVSDRGLAKRDSIEISVYAAKLATGGEVWASVSQLDADTYLLGSTDKHIYAFGVTGEPVWKFLTGGELRSTACIKDPEHIFVGSDDARLYSLNYEAEPNWDKAMGGMIRSSPSVTEEGCIYVGTSTGRFLSVSSEGEVKWSMQVNGAILSSPAISFDGRHIFFANTAGEIYCVSDTGGVLWTYVTGDSIVSSPAIGYDNSLVIGSTDGSLYKLSFSGEPQWRFDTGGPIKSSPAIGFGGMIYFGSADSSVYALMKTGQELWHYEASAAVFGSASISAHNQLYIGDDDGKMLVLDSSGILKWYLQTQEPVISSPLITGGNLLLVASLDGSAYVIQEALPAAPLTSEILEWPTFKANNKRTGQAGDISTSVADNDELPSTNFELLQNYPNPFNAETQISFTIPLQTGEFELRIYDITGRAVRTFAPGPAEPGVHTLIWDGRDERGNLVSSGLYVYRLRAGSVTLAKRMLLLK